ncbi:MAG TPA: MFS transporter [Mycobacteriales bacterium]|nr:MFS transporter [Mycobacteriales bacterium]
MAAAVVTRASTSVLSLSLLLAAHAATGSYAVAGLVLTGHATALALAAPISGRWVDRLHPRPVLLACLGLHLFAYAGVLTALGLRAWTGALVGCAALLGASTPPSSAVIRGTWPAVVPSDRLPTAYALDSAINEATFVSGPLLVSAVVTFASPYVLIVLAGSCTLLGVVTLVLTPSLRHSRPAPREKSAGPRRWLGPLAERQVRLLLTMAAMGALCYGAMQIGAAATVARIGATGSVGIVVGAMSAGAVLGGLGYGSRPWPGNQRYQVAFLYVGSGALVACAAIAPGVTALALIFAAAGLVGGPRDCIEQTLLAEASPQQSRTETFAWLNTFMWTGYGVGTAVAGRLVTESNASQPFLIGAVACAVATLAALALRARTGAPTPTSADDRLPETAEI